MILVFLARDLHLEEALEKVTVKKFNASTEIKKNSAAVRYQVPCLSGKPVNSND
jgi:hypothetical protein